MHLPSLTHSRAPGPPIARIKLSLQNVFFLVECRFIVYMATFPHIGLGAHTVGIGVIRYGLLPCLTIHIVYQIDRVKLDGIVLMG